MKTTKFNSREIKKQRSVASVFRGVSHWFGNLLLGNRLVTILVKPLELRFRVTANTIFSWNLKKYSAYEPANTNWITDTFDYDSGGLFVDVGANFGWYTCLFGKISGKSGQLVAFEPDLENLVLLKENLKSNEIENVNIIEAAVGEKIGKTVLRFAPDSNPGMHSLVQLPHTTLDPSGREVSIVTLDDALRPFAGKISLLKIDVEGFEIDALLGATETLSRCEKILVEYSPEFLRSAGRNPTDLIKILCDNDFEIFNLENGHPKIMTVEDFTNVEAGAKKWFCHQLDLICMKKNSLH